MANVVIVDSGSSTIKVGRANKSKPEIVHTSLVGIEEGSGKIVTGSEALFLGPGTVLNYPIDQGTVNNWEDAEKLWDQIFTDNFKINRGNHSILMSVSNDSSPEDCAKLAEIMLEKFQFKQLGIVKTANLALTATDKTTGLVVDCGHTGISIVPIIEGKIQSDAVVMCEFGGLTITEFMVQKFAEMNRQFLEQKDRLVVDEIKEKGCCVALDFDEVKGSSDTFDSSTLGNIDIGNLKYAAPECLFTTSMLGFEENNLPQAIDSSLQLCEPSQWSSLVENVVLCGGTSMFPGLPERLSKELMNLGSHWSGLNITADPMRNFYSWKGGSITSGSDDFGSKWISLDDFKEKGASLFEEI